MRECHPQFCPFLQRNELKSTKISNNGGDVKKGFRVLDDDGSGNYILKKKFTPLNLGRKGIFVDS